ncbi:MAG: proline iminopeptidase-family hydrolase [Nitrososphaerales archaeon]|jgi:proline-specific peptidase
MSARTEGYARVDGHRIFYRSFGDSKRVLVALHGGPGATHSYLLQLASLASRDLRVVLYDQLGCGKSDRPRDLSAYKIETAAAQLDALLDELGVERANLLGHSYGGFLALEYALGHRSRLDSLILSSTSASVPRTVEELVKLRGRLPRAMRETMDRCEAAGDLRDPAYLKCIDHLYHRHICILEPWPEEVERLFRDWAPDIYREMWGANEFWVTGNLKDWDVSARLPSIDLPTLVTVGRRDELPIPLAEELRDGIRGSGLRIFEKSSHMAMIEEPEAYLAAVSAALPGKDRAS